MKLYRYLTGPDDDSFCHRVTAELNSMTSAGLKTKKNAPRASVKAVSGTITHRLLSRSSRQPVPLA